MENRIAHLVTIDRDEKFVRKVYATCTCGWVGSFEAERDAEKAKKAHLIQVEEREQRVQASRP